MDKTDNEFDELLQYASDCINRQLPKEREDIDLSKYIEYRVREGQIRWDVARNLLKKDYTEADKIFLKLVVDDLNNKISKCSLARIVQRTIQDFDGSADSNMKSGDAFRLQQLFRKVNNIRALEEEYQQVIITEYRLPKIDVIMRLSALEYEKRFTKTSFLFCDKEECSDAKLILTFDNDKLVFDEMDKGIVRKIMEMAGADNCVVVETSEISGRISHRIIGITKKSELNGIYVIFRRKLCWDIMKSSGILGSSCVGENKKHDKEGLLLSYVDGKFVIPTLARHDTDEQQFKSLKCLSKR